MYTPFQPTLTTKGLSHFGLSMEIQRPSAALSGSILAYLQVKIDQATPYPMIPDGTNVLFFSSRGGLVAGSQLSILEVQLMESGEYFGVWFKPGMLRQIFDVDLSDITQRLVQDDFLSNRDFLHLSNRLYEKSTFLERVQLCEALMMSSLSPQITQKIPQAFHYAVQRIYHFSGNLTIAELAQHVGLSDRQLNRIFSLHTGLSTKAFTQIIRTQALLRGCYEDKLSTFHRALDLGFYDQSHLSKSLSRHSVDSLSLKARMLMSDFYKPHNSKTS
jgi:AraC-like DNA-binding protein